MKIWLTVALIAIISLLACQGTAVKLNQAPKIITEDYPPFNFIDKNKNVVGQSTEIVQALLKKLGLSAEIEMMPLSKGLEIAQKGPNTAIYSLNRTAERETLFKWVGPIGHYEQAFYTRADSNITFSKLEDAKNVGKIAVYKGDAGAQFLASQGFNNLNESQTDLEALKKLINREVDLWLGNRDGLEIMAKEAGISPEDLKLIPTVVIRADLYIAFSKDVPDSTVKAWQKALDQLKQERDLDGKSIVDRIQAKYSDIAFIESLLR